LELARATNPDLVILDLILTEIGGLSICGILRHASQLPILILTAPNRELDKVEALGSGVDAYLTKPFAPVELQARLRALLRRARSPYVADEIRAGNLRLNLASRRGFLRDRELKSSPKEFALLAELKRHRDALLTRDLLLARIWGSDNLGDSPTVDVHANNLREIIEIDPAPPS